MSVCWFLYIARRATLAKAIGIAFTNERQLNLTENTINRCSSPGKN